MENNVNISVITILSKNNHGSMLQAYATYKYLSNQGYDVEIIDYLPKIKSTDFKQLLYRAALNLVLRKRRKELWRFIEKNTRLTIKKYRSYAQLAKFPPKADVYIVGSDQVWSDEIYTGGVNLAYLLAFIKGKKLAYASSIGKIELADDSLMKIELYLKDFSHISVREQSAKDILAKMDIGDVDVVLDPVFLLSQKQYKDIMVPYEIPYKFVLVYTFEKSDIIDHISKDIANRFKLKIVEIGAPFSKCNSDIFLKNLKVEEFLYVLDKAEYVVTSSFHGTALSIILRKQFISIPPNRRSTRVINILDTFGMQERMIDSITKYNGKLISEPIDYSKYEDVINLNIRNSAEYLIRSIEN